MGEGKNVGEYEMYNIQILLKSTRKRKIEEEEYIYSVLITYSATRTYAHSYCYLQFA